MSQAQLSLRAHVDQSHIARIELGKVEADLATLRRLFDGLFCDLLVVPKPRRELGDVLSERNADSRRPDHRHTSLWAEREPR